MNNFKLLFSDLYRALRGGCWLNHRYQLLKAEEGVAEHKCKRCGKHIYRRL